MSSRVYVDTSALAKWYLNEARSEDVEQYLVEHAPVFVSDLTTVEMRALLARRRRERTIDALLESEVFATFQEDLRRGTLRTLRLPEAWAAGCVALLAALPAVPLRTLDALHLVVARESCQAVATADRIMAQAARGLGLSVVGF